MSETAPRPQVSSGPAAFLGLELPEIRGSVLVVEDEGFVREVTGEILQAAGYHVLSARNAAEAVRLFRTAEREVELLVTDVVLPGRNGHDLAKDLRALSPELKVIFVSGYPENPVTRKSCCMDGTVYLPKPFSVESLMQKVRRAFAGEKVV